MQLPWWVQSEGADGVTVVRGGPMQTIEAGFKLFEWQRVIGERNAVRSVFSGRSTSYQVFVMRLLEEGFTASSSSARSRPLSTEPVWASSFIAPTPAYPRSRARGGSRAVRCEQHETNGDPIPPH